MNVLNGSKMKQYKLMRNEDNELHCIYTILIIHWYNKYLPVFEYAKS